MQRLEVRILSSALVDLGDIHSFVLGRSGSDSVAERFVAKLLLACERIGMAPWGGTQRDDLEPGIRTWSFQRRVLIAYRIEADTVDVVALFYKGRDVEACFRDLRSASTPR